MEQHYFFQTVKTCNIKFQLPVDLTLCIHMVFNIFLFFSISMKFCSIVFHFLYLYIIAMVFGVGYNFLQTNQYKNLFFRVHWLILSDVLAYYIICS